MSSISDAELKAIIEQISEGVTHDFRWPCKQDLFKALSNARKINRKLRLKLESQKCLVAKLELELERRQ